VALRQRDEIPTEHRARDLTRLIILRGGMTDGSPPDTIGSTYASILAELHRIAMDEGVETMATAAIFAEAAIEAGIVYPGEETIRFLADVARHVQDAGREIGGTQSRF
jgi:hypothetical protein